MDEIDCYKKLYGDKVFSVDFYWKNVMFAMKMWGIQRRMEIDKMILDVLLDNEATLNGR